MSEITMPANGWLPRPHQRPLWDYFTDPITKKFDGTGKRAIEIAHRRWGKDDISLHLTAKASICRPATYWHMLPEAAQARKAIWQAVDPHVGKRRIDIAFPHEWRETTLENEMLIRFKWGSTWQVVGSDNYQSLVGTPPAGIVVSEWAKAHPGAWGYLAPILVENKGWAVFITTPEGRNHAHTMYEMARTNPKWFADLQTVEDSIRMSVAAGVEPTMTLEMVEEQRLEYHAIYGEEAGDALIQQEYWCSFSAAILGAYWGKEMDRCDREGRISPVDRIKGYPVHRAWDIGVDDPMAIWCFQVGPGWLHILDYIEGSGYGFDFYANQLAERGFLDDKRGIDHVPHDAKMREAGAPDARTRIQTMFTLGLNPQLVPDHKPMDRINAVRRLLPRVHFNSEAPGMKQGLECLRQFKQKWNPTQRTFQKTADHNWASHGADAFGHLAVSVNIPTEKVVVPKRTIVAVPPLTLKDLMRTPAARSKWE